MEATNPAGEEFGEARILSVVRPTIGKRAADVLRQIADEGQRFVEDGQFHDDLTILIVKLSPRTGSPMARNDK